MPVVTTLCWLLLILPSADQDRPIHQIPASAYVASAVPAVLPEDTRAVIRHEELSIVVSGVAKAEYRLRRIVTVLEPEGGRFAEFSVYYDRFSSVHGLKGTLYDSLGRRIRDLGDEDITDYPAISDYSLYEDHRVRSASLRHAGARYTVDYEYTVRMDGYLAWPRWSPEAQNAFVEKSVFTVTVPEEGGLRIWERGAGEPVVSAGGRGKSYTWVADSLEPFVAAPYSSPTDDRNIIVCVAPEKFEIDGYPGDMTSWQSLGRWFGMLMEGKQELPPGVQGEISGLLAGVTTRRDTIRALYEYHQSRSRYVSVQLGIGGWQPYDATYVHERGYGDCKALTNYMRSLLASVGIPSIYAPVIHDDYSITEMRDFPSQQFNHVVLCVPLGPDTVWLECTSRDIPFGHLGRMSENRDALLVLPDGGRLVTTPASSPGENAQVRDVTVTLDPTGNAYARVRTSFTGNQQDYVRGALFGASPVERDQWLRNNIDLPAFTIREAEYSGVVARSQVVDLRYEMEIPRYATSSGKRLVFKPNLLERRTQVPRKLSQRRFPVRFSYRYADRDTVRFSYPPGYVAEAAPGPVELDTDFGYFRSEVRAIDDTTLQFSRHLEIRSLELPPERYDEFRDFTEKIVRADRAVVSLVKKF